jgi:hypothetical protein
MILLFAALIIAAPEPRNNWGALEWTLFLAWLVIGTYAFGWPAWTGRNPEWMETLYYRTWGRLLGDYRLKK